MEKIIWKPLRGFDGYEVSNRGGVRNMNWRSPGRVRELHPCYDRDGYMMVCLTVNGHQKNYRVHRLVAMTFLPTENMENLHVNHKDENRANNCVENLEWVTCAENNNYGYHNKRMSTSKRNRRSIPVEQYDLQGNLIAVWPSAHEVKRKLGFDHAMIARCCTHRAQTGYGYRWEYQTDGR